MQGLRFQCNASEQFIVWELPAWVKRQGFSADETVIVEVLHPAREMDGSCRWCGGRRNETVAVRGDHIL